MDIDKMFLIVLVLLMIGIFCGIAISNYYNYKMYQNGYEWVPPIEGHWKITIKGEAPK